MIKKVLAMAALSTRALTSAMSPIEKELERVQRDGIKADSSLGRSLIAKSRRVQDYKNYEYDITFMSDYSVKFLGCYHVTQWDPEGNGEDNTHVVSKGLVRYRLCKSSSCSDKFSSGCSNHYGEYVVDMTDFLEVYVEFQMAEQAYKCATYRNTCYKECYESTNMNCYSKCYKNYGVEVSMCAYQNDGQSYTVNGEQFVLEDFLECGLFQQGNDDSDLSYYLGPYCPEQGADIRLGFFEDELCTLPSNHQASYFEKVTGQEIPFTKASIVHTNCMSCETTDVDAAQEGYQDYYNYDSSGNRNYYVTSSVNDLCASIYLESGKCETLMDQEDVPYPEEGACKYVEGIKKLQGDGIIRSNQGISSKPAAVAIGVFTGAACLLGGYVYYLKSKIARSRVNLAGASASLT